MRLNTGAPCRVRHVIPSNLVLGDEETRKKCSYFIYWCFLLCCWWRHDGRSPVSAQLIQWNIHHARYSHTQNVVAGAFLSLSFVHHFLSFFTVFGSFFNSLFQLFMLFSFLIFYAFSFRLSLPFVLSFIWFSLFMFACFFSQLPKQRAEQFRAFVKTACSSLPQTFAAHGRVQLKCDGTRWRTGGKVNGKLANGVGSQYSSHFFGTWCIQHYYRWCAHLGYQ